jgi:hypothetical protein
MEGDMEILGEENAVLILFLAATFCLLKFFVIIVFLFHSTVLS